MPCAERKSIHTFRRAKSGICNAWPWAFSATSCSLVGLALELVDGRMPWTCFVLQDFAKLVLLSVYGAGEMASLLISSCLPWWAVQLLRSTMHRHFCINVHCLWKAVQTSNLVHLNLKEDFHPPLKPRSGGDMNKTAAARCGTIPTLITAGKLSTDEQWTALNPKFALKCICHFFLEFRCSVEGVHCRGAKGPRMLPVCKLKCTYSWILSKQTALPAEAMQRFKKDAELQEEVLGVFGAIWQPECSNTKHSIRELAILCWGIAIPTQG